MTSSLIVELVNPMLFPFAASKGMSRKLSAALLVLFYMIP